MGDARRPSRAGVGAAHRNGSGAAGAEPDSRGGQDQAQDSV